jgi:MoxR-like ATPase
MNDYISDEEAREAREKIDKLLTALRQVLFGQDELLEGTVTGLLAGGHILLEGLPGLGKTELVKGLARLLKLTASRIQFTPDLLPGDITGNPILKEENGERKFVFQKGPVFTNLLLADEINRASPKTQSALLEAMQEARVSVMGETHRLPEPFFVLATQNPIELEGTYPLPEAQLDRFLMKLQVFRNPVNVLEQIIANREIGEEVEVQPVLDVEELKSIMADVRRVYLPPVVGNYIARLVNGTHVGESEVAQGLKFGASPRAALGLAASCRARALMQGRTNTSFEDVRAVAVPVLQHRIILDYTTRISGRTSAQLVNDLLQEIPAQEKDLPETLHVPSDR